MELFSIRSKKRNLFFQTRLNPCDDKDVLEILQSLVQFSGDGDANEILDEFDEKISVYLKYEWEKAKREVNYFSWLKISYWLTFVTLLCYTVLCDAVAKSAFARKIGICCLVAIVTYKILERIVQEFDYRTRNCSSVSKILGRPLRKRGNTSILCNIIEICCYLIIIAPLFFVLKILGCGTR